MLRSALFQWSISTVFNAKTFRGIKLHSFGVLESLRSFTQEDVNSFAKISGDWNPIHISGHTAVDVGQAPRPIVHGTLVVG